MYQDIVAELPDEVASYEKEHGRLPDDLKLEPGLICKYNDKYFVHTRATLPLKSIDTGVGFGLWVEVDTDTFISYYEALEDDELYKDFKAEGKLANEWPGFKNLYGVSVTFRTIKTDDKVYITEVHDIQNRDPLFYSVMLAQADDIEKIKEIEELTQAYMENESQK